MQKKKTPSLLKKIKNKILPDKRIAHLTLEGIIMDSKTVATATKFLENLKKVKKEKFECAVIKINSPGGTVGASQEIYQGVLDLKKEGIKVIASLGDVAASGGVYVAMAADKIVANPGTVTGSIGVIIKGSNLQELYKKIGVESKVVKSGLYKDILTTDRPMTDDEKAILQEMIQSTYEQFVQVVAGERNIPIEDVKAFADGRIFTGDQALAFGLVDQLGSFQTAIDLACKMMDIKGEPQVIKIERKKSLLDKLSQLSCLGIGEYVKSAELNTLYGQVPLWMMK